MNISKSITVILSLILVSLISATLIVVGRRETDYDITSRIKAQTLKIPEMEYPKVDVKNRSIPKFDILVVLPECKSCSNFRVKAEAFMSTQPQAIFLVLTPDTKDMTSLLSHNRYFIAQFDSKSRYANISPGVYTR